MAIPWMGHFMLEQDLLRQWIRDAKAGDAAAFERIVMLHERMVLRTAQRLLLNPEDAKDAAQEVFLRLHRNLDRFREREELGPWLRRITVNICLDAMRRSRRETHVEGTVDVPCPALDPEEALSRTQQRELIAAALGRLSERERVTIVLRDLEGCTTSEVAEILGSTETTVRSQISTGRAKIRSFVAAQLRKRR